MTQPPSGEWVYFETELTNSSGRVSYVIPENKRLGIGVYPVKMVVRYGNLPLLNLKKGVLYSLLLQGLSVSLFHFPLSGATIRLPTAI